MPEKMGRQLSYKAYCEDNDVERENKEGLLEIQSYNGQKGLDYLASEQVIGQPRHF